MVKIIAARKGAAEELGDKLCGASSHVKMVLGVVNNVAVAVMLHALSEVKKHPKYKHEVKRLYMNAINEMHNYEKRLLHAEVNRFFHVEDMTDVARKSYDRNLTDRQYFELWQGMGSGAYQKVFPLITCLQNKFKVSMERHGVKYASLVSWPMTALACLNIANRAYSVILGYVGREWDINQGIVDEVFKDFSMERVTIAWHRAVYATEYMEYDLEPSENKNIEISVLQLAETLANSDVVYDSVIQALPEYSELFRTEGVIKKAQRQLKGFKSDSSHRKHGNTQK